MFHFHKDDEVWGAGYANLIEIDQNSIHNFKSSQSDKEEEHQD